MKTSKSNKRIKCNRCKANKSFGIMYGVYTLCLPCFEYVDKREQEIRKLKTKPHE